MATYILSPPTVALLVSWAPVGILAVVAVVVVGLCFWNPADTRKKHAVTMIIFLSVLAVTSGVTFYLSNPTVKNSVTISHNQFSIKASPYFSTTVQADQVAQAYVVNLNGWNLSITGRNPGTSIGNYNCGVFQLSNNATAYLLSGSQTDLVIKTTGGTYFVLAPDNFSQFVSGFSQNIVQVEWQG